MFSLTFKVKLAFKMMMIRSAKAFRKKWSEMTLGGILKMVLALATAIVGVLCAYGVIDVDNKAEICSWIAIALAVIGFMEQGRLIGNFVTEAQP